MALDASGDALPTQALRDNGRSPAPGIAREGAGFVLPRFGIPRMSRFIWGLPEALGAIAGILLVAGRRHAVRW